MVALTALAGCERAPSQPPQPTTSTGPTCDAGECNTRGMAALSLARNAEAIYAEGKLVPLDLAKARTMYDQACARRDAYGCFTAGMFASDGRGGPRSPEAAGERFDQACTLGHATACFNAGVLRMLAEQRSAANVSAAVLARGPARSGGAH